jgi:polyisoprenoid-binding protein YceI
MRSFQDQIFYPHVTITAVCLATYVSDRRARLCIGRLRKHLRLSRSRAGQPSAFSHPYRVRNDGEKSASNLSRFAARRRVDPSDHGIEMRNHLAVSALFPLFCMLLPVAWAQTISERIDSGHSTASLTVESASGGSPWNAGIAKVSGMVQWDGKDASKSTFDFTIYPARQSARLLNPDGSVRSYTAANLSRYTVMTFHSDRVQADQTGKLEVHGTLAITHVAHETNTVWSNAYAGAEYGAPIEQRTAGEVVFTIENPSSAAWLGRADAKISGLATLNRSNFPELRTTILDAVWPIVVEDEHCEMPGPKPSLKDYQGAICTGNPIEVTPISQPPERFGIDYPGPDEITAPRADRVTIALRMNLVKAHSDGRDGPAPK